MDQLVSLLARTAVSPELPEELKCKMTQELMTDPVMDCAGHTYERSAIEKWLQDHPGVSPLTNKQYSGGSAKLVPNYVVKSVIVDYLLQHGTPQATGGSSHIGAPPTSAQPV